jgi:hypothetical protein
MRDETQDDTVHQYAERHWGMPLLFSLFSFYICFLYGRELGQPLHAQFGPVEVLVMNGSVVIFLVWLIGNVKSLRERLVVVVGISNSLYQSVLAIAPGLASLAVPAMRVAFLVAWFIAALLSLSSLKSALAAPPHQRRCEGDRKGAGQSRGGTG